MLRALKEFPQFSALDYSSEASDDILEIIEERDFDERSALGESVVEEDKIQISTESLATNVWGESVLAGFHSIPVDNYVEPVPSQGVSDERPQAKTIDEDASLDQIRAFLADSNL